MNDYEDALTKVLRIPAGTANGVRRKLDIPHSESAERLEAAGCTVVEITSVI